MKKGFSGRREKIEEDQETCLEGWKDFKDDYHMLFREKILLSLIRINVKRWV